MHAIAQSDLPFRGMSFEFVGADHGAVQVSVYLVEAPSGRKTSRHRHPYDEVAFVQEGRGRWTVDGEEQELSRGDILVIKAGQVHEFVNIGPGPLIQFDLHLNGRFIQEDLDSVQTPTSWSRLCKTPSSQGRS